MNFWSLSSSLDSSLVVVKILRAVDLTFVMSVKL
jgi:hypothetical protein